ncbi:MAG: cysteine--tRNA ligase [Clostridiales bacterium]|nr:cysteine--tRNA ligase [Clostridiales bacterium]
MKLYNTMTRKKEEFVPITPGKVGMYSCGPTVYNYFHLGNARPFIVFDTLRRYFEYLGYDVTRVQNFTDIDDKMINKANEMGITVKELADRFIAEYYVDADGLNVAHPTVAPLATEHIPEIIHLVETLIEKGLAYESQGDVYYAAKKFPGYAKLSGQNLDELEAGARVDVAEIKRDPMDFALWKAAKPGEPSWESPWGLGRPGWHVECSAMSMKYLGESFDIHTGGQDLIFPHHDNEIAQSEGATGKTYVNYWLHNGYINVDNRKMSKSLNNFFTIRDISSEFDLMAVRLFMLTVHYRSPINYSRDLIVQAEAALGRIRNAHDLLSRIVAAPWGEGAKEAEFVDSIGSYRDRFKAAMDDDLNTADALGVVFEFVREANTVFVGGGSKEGAQAALNLLDELMGVLGIIVKVEESIPEEVLKMAEERQAARAARDWAKADALRNEITAMGYVVEDTKNGPVVKKA